MLQKSKVAFKMFPAYKEKRERISITNRFHDKTERLHGGTRNKEPVVKHRSTKLKCVKDEEGLEGTALPCPLSISGNLNSLEAPHRETLLEILFSANVEFGCLCELRTLKQFYLNAGLPAVRQKMYPFHTVLTVLTNAYSFVSR